jgi:hypothetical protein
MSNVTIYMGSEAHTGCGAQFIVGDTPCIGCDKSCPNVSEQSIDSIIRLKYHGNTFILLNDVGHSNRRLTTAEARENV